MKRLLATSALVLLLALAADAAGPASGEPPLPAVESGRQQEPASERGLLGGLAVGLIALGGVVLLARLFLRKNRQDSPDADNGSRPAAPARPDRYDQARAMWESLRSKPAPAPTQAGPQGQAAPEASGSEAEFLRGAKAVYARITQAAAASDFDDAAQFALPEAVEEMRARAPASAGRVDILLIEARLLSRQTVAGQEEATVEYEALLREGQETQPRTRREVWRFVRPAGEPAATWKLASTAGRAITREGT
jgi:predicted lipid-binding transport protein (Tim44 family)